MNESNNNDTLIEFPCDFPIKVVSKNSFELEDFVTMVVHSHSPHMEFIPISKNESKTGKYQAITVTVAAISKQQLDKIYQDLSANKSIIMVL